MIVFLTLFLGLVAGVQTVELAVDDGVTAVELRLDGELVATLRGEPWAFTCDLGADLAPHHLVAIALDPSGQEIDRTEQWINLPRARTEIQLRAGGAEGAPPDHASLVWSSVDAAQPDSVTVTFDGAALDASNLAAIPLPAYDPAQIHLLKAEVRLGPDVTRQEIVVGGQAGSVSSDLTAVLLTLKDGPLPTVAEVQGRLTRAGETLRVVAVEQSPAEVLMVQDLSFGFQGRLRRIQEQALKPRQSAMLRPTGLKEGDRFRLLIPIPAVVSEETRSVQFPMSPDLWGTQKEAFATGASERQIPAAMPKGLLVAIPALPGKRADTTDQRLADGVATAAVAAAAERRPRTVVLVTGAKAPDRGRFSPSAVRAYLQKLQVPLRVWSPDADEIDPGWGEVQDVSSYNELFRAFRELRASLDQQLIVWVEGRYLPHEIEIRGEADDRLQPLAGGLLPIEAEPADGAETLPEAQVAEAETSTREAVMNEPVITEAGPTEVPVGTFGARVEVREVSLDVVVTDRKGRVIRDLDKDDFEIFEDGQKVEIERFRPPPAETEAMEKDPEAVPPPSSLVVFLDLFHLGPAQVRRVVADLEEGFADGPTGLEAMLVTYDGSLQVAQGFTSDLALLRQAFEEAGQKPASLRGRVDQEDLLVSEMAAVQQEMEEAMRLQGREREVALGMARNRRNAAFNQLRGVGEIRRTEIRQVIALIRQLVSSLGGLEGKKALMYVGDRLALEPAAPLYELAAGLAQFDPDEALDGSGAAARVETEAQSLETGREFNTLVREANGQGVTFYSLTPPGRLGGSGGPRASAGNQGTDVRYFNSRDEGVRSAVCMMSNGTGGVCRAGASELQPALAAAFEDISASYSLGYVPVREPDGEFHKIRVEVVPAGLRVRHREGYLDKARGDRLQDRVLTALLFGAEENSLGIAMTLGVPEASPAGGDLILLPVALRMPVDHLALMPTTDGKARRATLRLYVATLAEDGRSTAVQEFPVTFEVSEEQLAGVPNLSYTHKVSLSLAPGSRAIAIGFWDEVGRGGSFLRRDVLPQAEATDDSAAVGP